MSAFFADVRYAIRQLIRQPSYGIIVVVLMSLGIAGNAAVFRVFNGLFLRPLPFDEPGQLVDLDETAPAWDLEYVSIAYPDFVAWRRDSRTFEAMTVFSGGGTNFSTNGSAERVDYLAATHDLDEVLGLDPQLGRFWGPEEDVPDGPLVAMLSAAFWEQRFARDRAVLGQAVTLNGQPYEIIGVLPPEAEFIDDADLWIPLQGDETEGGSWSYNGIGRLRSGVSIDQAEQDLLAIHKGMIEERGANEITSPVIQPLRERYLGDYRMGTGFLLAAVGIVLLIACANIAGIMYARALSRAPEIAVRRVMGAQRGRIVRQLLTESVVLAGVGALAGGALGVWGSSFLVAPMADQFPEWTSFDLDWRFLAFTLLVTGLAAVLFGLAPALQASGSGSSLNAMGRSTDSRGKRRALGVLVTGEVALALTLLVAGGLSVLDVHRLGGADPGFETEGVIAYQLQLPSVRYEDDEAILAFVSDYEARLAALPGVTSVGLGSSLPLMGHWGWFFHTEGAAPRAEDEGNPVVLNRAVTPGYFETMGIELVAGRFLNEFDGRDEGSLAVVVNETFVRTHLSDGADPLGRRVAPGTGPADEDDAWMTVVGVTKDVMHYGVGEEMRPGVYQPLRQLARTYMYVALRHAGDAGAVVSAARSTTAETDPELPLFSVSTMRETLDESLWARRATSWLVGAFSTIALLLAVAGIYGVVSYSVGERTREISIRMAMGARSGQVLNQVVRQGMWMVVIGVGAGLAGSLAAAGAVAGMLVGVSPTEPVIYVGVTLLLLTVAALANYVPARRAAALDPMRALRGE